VSITNDNQYEILGNYFVNVLCRHSKYQFVKETIQQFKIIWRDDRSCAMYFAFLFHEVLRAISIATFAKMPASWLRDAVLQSIFLSEPLRRAIELRECTFLVRSKRLTRRRNRIYWNFRRIETNSSEEVQESFNSYKETMEELLRVHLRKISSVDIRRYYFSIFCHNINGTKE